MLKEHNYGAKGEYVGLDVKAMRTTRDADSYKHLENSLNIFKALEAKVVRWDYGFEKQCVEKRDYEALEMYVLKLLMGHSLMKALRAVAAGHICLDITPLFPGDGSLAALRPGALANVGPAQINHRGARLRTPASPCAFSA